MPEHIEAVLADARSGAVWREALGVPQPSAPLGRALDTLDDLVRDVAAADGEPTLMSMLAVVREPDSDDELNRLAHRVLQSALEQRRVRQVRQGVGANAAYPPTISNG